jgi:VanZ family protein
MPGLPKHPGAWLSAWLAWFGVLWFLSTLPGSDTPQLFPHFDKVEHFGWFAGGGFLFAGWRYTRRPDLALWKTILVTTILAIALTGFIDEWHQCYTPGRSGADPWDWLADVLGGSAGALLCKAVHRRLQ